ncbi:MAG: hypothetical protein ING75_01755 [Rhodocyclaceae bacterium]|nr:hypothetical protein [Rhodocyclaceae bacterium]
MTSRHCLIWIDHHKAKLIHVGHDIGEVSVIDSKHDTKQLHVKAHKSLTHGNGNASLDREFLRAVIDGVNPAAKILLTGPADAKQELMHFAEQHQRDFSRRVVKMEALDRATDGELLDHARRFFGLPQLRPGSRSLARPS